MERVSGKGSALSAAINSSTEISRPDSIRTGRINDRGSTYHIMVAETDKSAICGHRQNRHDNTYPFIIRRLKKKQHDHK